MLKVFRAVSLIEGVSFLLILGVSFNFISRDWVFSLGMGHGILFVLYFILSLIASHKQGWSVVVWLLVLFASLIPFAFIPVELFLQKEMVKKEIELSANVESE